jgi:hypothetical protein
MQVERICEKRRASVNAQSRDVQQPPACKPHHSVANLDKVVAVWSLDVLVWGKLAALGRAVKQGREAEVVRHLNRRIQ